MTKKNPKLGLGIDLGSANLAGDVFDGKKLTPIESPFDGSQIPTIAYWDEANDEWYFGSDAVLRSYNDKNDNLATHMKRNLPESAHEKLYCGGKFSPVEILAKFIAYFIKLLVAARPELKDHAAFGGTKYSEDELGITFTVPSNWSIQEQTAYEEAIRKGGFRHFDGSIAEPIAAVRRVARESQIQLCDGDLILVVDVGAGTTDCTACKYNRGVFDQVAAASGDGYMAGHDFTNALAEAIAKKNHISWDGVYGKGGLNLRDVKPRRRPQIMAVWMAAEDAKKKLSVLDEVTVPVEFPKGRRTFSFTREEAAQLWQPLVERFKECIANALEGTQFSFSDVDHPMLVGGSSRLPGLREAMAETMARSVSEILVCTDSEHIVSGGAAEHAYHQDDASQSHETGLGFRVFDPSLKGYRNILMVEPGQILPPDGLYMERAGFQISTVGGRKTLICDPFVCKSGVRASVVHGRETFLTETETVRLQSVTAPLDGFPDGEHDIVVGIKADPNRNLRLLIRPTNLPQVEPLTIPLLMEHGATSSAQQSMQHQIALVLDCSGSMHGDKVQMLKRGATKFVQLATERGANVAIIRFPNGALLEACLECATTNNVRQLEQAIESLFACGGTPLGAGLQLAEKTLPSERTEDQLIAVLFTDGIPNYPASAVAAANSLKQSTRLITVGIGDDVNRPWLVDLASTREDYFDAECPEDILGAFQSVAQLIWTGSGTADASEEDHSNLDDWGYERDEDWNEIEDEEAA